MAGATYRLSPQQTLTVTSSSAEMIAVEASWTGGGNLPPAHFHPAQDERFEVLEGQLRVLVNDSERMLKPGDVLDVPRGTVHAIIATGNGARAIWQTRPALRTHEYFARMDIALARGGSVLSYAPVFRTHAAEVRLVKPPAWIQRPLFAVLATVGKLLRR